MSRNLFFVTLDRAKEVAKQLREAGRRTATYEGQDDGKTIRVKGWPLYHINSWDDTKNGGTSHYQQDWGSRELVLGVDGKIYEHWQNRTDYGPGSPGGARRIHERRLKLADKLVLANLGGRPFRKVLDQLKSL